MKVKAYRMKSGRSLKRLFNRFLGKASFDSAASPEWFDREWYLHHYPDVAAAEMDPWAHYSRFGRAEGRLPAPNRALAMGDALWRGGHDVIQPRLEALIAAPGSTVNEQQHARWELARWYAWKQEWSIVVRLLMPFNAPLEYPQNKTGSLLLLVEALCRLMMTHDARPSEWAAQLQSVTDLLNEGWPEQTDTLLAHANAKLALEGEGADAVRLQLMNQLFARHSLATLAWRNPCAPLGLDNLFPRLAQFIGQQDGANLSSLPLVSVIIPVYNAANTLPTVLRSLYGQTWPRLELLLVDDASTDESLAVIARLSSECPAHIHQRLLQHEVNKGAYAARNTALAVADGDFITVHDSDDWSHPQKLERQASALVEQASPVACLTWWVRVSDELFFHRWRLDDHGWVYPNISSLMFRREVFEQLGYWDQVRVNADTEYRERIEMAFGNQAVVEVLPGVPLSFGRADEGSLSQHSATHLITQFSGARYAYMKAAKAWHARAQCPADLYLSQHPLTRPFIAPHSILLSATSDSTCDVSEFELKDRARVSGWFDAGWYLQRYIALQQALIEPFEHFWDKSASLGYDPGPNFSSSGYLRICPEAAQSENPLWHYLQSPNPAKALPVWRGKVPIPDKPTIMVCGHQAGPRLFGAERSLIDVVDAYTRLGANVVVTLPEALNLAYEQAMLKHCTALAVLPYGWWQKGRQPVEATVQHFSELIKRFNVSAVHANTLVLDEPLRAARQCKVPAIIHVRELPAADQALCETLGCDPAGIMAHAADLADLLIANSRYTRRELEQSLPTECSRDTPVCVVPNTVEMDSLLSIPELSGTSAGRVLRVGMLSSNLPKKGLADAEALGELLEKQKVPIELVLIGPETDALQTLLKRQADGRAPANITYHGYVSDPAEVLADLDAVINLSRFQESFGRTVLEAMAAARPVVAYDWGALSELVVPGETGYLAALGDVQAVAGYLRKLASAPESCAVLGHAGRERAWRVFGQDALMHALGNAYRAVDLVMYSKLSDLH
ncbi:glycosyltransferase [Marinobacterium sp. YM272]|uniref:glycosyltransferase n=1 Tax=Marinobacterium sp. YM272 TaxID=3421654 RepID=UPI003D7F699B